MTMPHLMNCQHSESGWCLACVKELHAELEIAEGRIAELDPESWRCPVMLPNAYGKEMCGRKKGHEGKCCYERMD